MNCQDFKKGLDVIHLPGSAGRASARLLLERHARECEECGRLIGLVHEHSKNSLSAALSRVSEQDREVGLSEKQGAILLEAFRARHTAAGQKTIVTGPGFLAGLAAFFSLRGLAVTATVATIFAVSLWMWKSGSFVAPASPGVKLSPSATVSFNPEIAVRNNAPGAESVSNSMETPGLQNEERLATSIRNTRPITTSGAQRRGNVTADLGQFEIEEPIVAGNLSDFVAFDYAEHMAPPDAVRLMRVQMPPSRLVNMGIPVPVNLRSRELVNTDLLVGNDGNPRAIRVVY